MANLQLGGQHALPAGIIFVVVFLNSSERLSACKLTSFRKVLLSQICESHLSGLLYLSAVSRWSDLVPGVYSSFYLPQR